MRWRSLVALVLLAGYGISSAEVVLGELRDGEVHHESTATALDHTQGASAQGEHGHEDDGQEAEHGPEHEHGTSADHCTHSHSASLPGDQPAFSVIACTRTLPVPPATTRSDDTPDSLYRPPRA